MTSRQRLLSMGTARGERLLRELAGEMHAARIGLGISQREVGAIVGMSTSQISRIERALAPHPDIIQASRLAQVLGLEIWMRSYPSGAPVRDTAHLKLLARLRAVTHPAFDWQLESPIPIPGDLRAFDAVLRVPPVGIGVTAETHLTDIQALLRRERLKMRDARLDRLILLAGATLANRRALLVAGPALRAELPLDSRAILRALRSGVDPGGDGILLL